MTAAVASDALRAETVTITGHGGDEIEAYLARPLAPGSRGSVVVIHHMPGYDRETKEFVRASPPPDTPRCARTSTTARLPAPTPTTLRPPPGPPGECPTSGWSETSPAPRPT